MYKICILVDKFYKYGGGEIFLEDLLKNSSEKLIFKYLISLEKPQNVYKDPICLPIEFLEFNENNIKKVSEECDFLIFWGRVLDSVRLFPIKNKIMWAHSDYNVNYFLEKAEDYTTHYIACSTNVKNAINKKKCSIIYPGIDIDRYVECKITKEEIKNILGFEKKDFIIGQFCRFEKFKNIPYLIDAVSRIADSSIKILLIGHGSEMSNIIDLCEKKIPKRFQYIYYTDVKNMSIFFKCLDAFCLPSEGEGYARVQWESAIFGVPFIGTNVGGVEDGIINDHNGFIINEEKDIEKIIIKIKNKEFNNKIILNSYDFFIKEGHIKKTIIKIEKLFDKLFNNRKKFYI
jgi:glycosyltransferase involved in cell wall biosynthesis